MLRRSPGEVDLELVARDGDGGVDRELAALDRLERVGGLEPPVREARDRCADAALGVVVELVHRGLDAGVSVAVAELLRSSRRKPVRGQLGAEVAAALVGVAHPRDERVEDVLVEPRRRNDDALLIEPARARRQAPRLDGSDVGVMRARDRETGGRSRDEGDVGEVGAARERVVEDVDVVGAGVVGADGGDGVGHRA